MIGGTRNRMQLSLPVPKTPDGRVYRYSPNANAHPRHFVLGDTTNGFPRPTEKTPRMKQVPDSPLTVCPYSGTIAKDAEFTHPDDLKTATALVKHAAVADMTEAFHDMFKSLGRGQRSNSYVRIEVGSKPSPRPKPHFRRRDLLRELVCDECGRDYGVFAISLYCPDCGAPNIHLHFAREVELVGKQVDLAEAQRGEQEEHAYRLLGNAHEDVLTAFEATLKAVYHDRLAMRPPDAPGVKPVRNDFQNIQRARDRFAEFGLDPFVVLNADALAILTLNIQKRHVIGHNLGIADAAFAEHAGDARLGETILLVGKDIRRFADVCRQVINHLDTWLAGDVAPATDSKANVDHEEVRSMPNNCDSEFESLGSVAVRVGKWISENSQSGLARGIDDNAFKEAFKDVKEDELAIAIAELESEGHLTTQGALGLRIPHIRPTLDLFVAFDPTVHGHDPVADAADLIEVVLAGEDSVALADLHARVNWPLRRFNAAAALIVDHVGEGRVSREIGGQYPTRHFQMVAADRVELKNFLRQIRS